MELTIKLTKLDWDKVISYAKQSDQFYDPDIEKLSKFPRYMKGMGDITPKQLNEIHKIIIRLADEGLDI